jgi:hypothetical protein
VPEQLPLLVLLEIVRDRVESIHAGQRPMTAEIQTLGVAPGNTDPLHSLYIGRR